MGISWFGWRRILSLRVTLCFVTSSRTVGMSRSACRMRFGTYHGAFTIVLKTLFWKRCKISMSDWKAVPQRGVPYVQISFNIVLYSRSLFSSDNSDCLPMIQYIRLNESSNCFLLTWMCVLHVRRRSKWSPRYLTASCCGMGLPFRKTGGQSSRLSVKVTWVDLDSLAQIRHCCSQCSNWWRCVWRFEGAAIGSSWDARIAVSLEYVAVSVYSASGRSAVKIV
jgi:hypothetical protein